MASDPYFKEYFKLLLKIAVIQIIRYSYYTVRYTQKAMIADLAFTYTSYIYSSLLTTLFTDYSFLVQGVIIFNSLNVCVHVPVCLCVYTL